MHMYETETRKDLFFHIIKQETHEFSVALIVEKIYLKKMLRSCLLCILHLESVTFDLPNISKYRFTLFTF